MQPEVNIGLVGHVDHGKTTITEQFSGKWTDTHSEELKRGITIRLGYADTIIRRIPGAQDTSQYTVEKEVDGKETEPVRKISLIDAPGHESLMATMIAGASLMDGALLMVAANEVCPQPQTAEHLMTLEMSGVENIIVVQNKVDLVSEERAAEHYQQIKEFLKDTRFADAPVIPVSALRGVNMDLLLWAIQEYIPTPKRDPQAQARFLVARSFDTNKPGTKPDKMRGGVLGGAVVQGKLRAGDEIELRPGRVVEEANQKIARPIKTTILSMISGDEPQDELTPGGSSGVMTTLDPAIAASDSLAGAVVGMPGELPPIWYKVTMSVELLERRIGMSGSEEIEPLRAKELLMLNVNSSATVGVVSDLGKKQVTVALRMPICAAVGDRLTISRRIGTRFRLVGVGELLDGEHQE